MVVISIIVDVLNLPHLMFQAADSFEHKYEYLSQDLRPEQAVFLDDLFNKIFDGMSASQIKNTSLTLK